MILLYKRLLYKRSLVYTGTLGNPFRLSFCRLQHKPAYCTFIFLWDLMQSFPPLSSQYHHLVAVVVVGQRVSEQDEPVQQPDGAALSQRAPRSLRQLRPAKLRPVLAGKEVKL